MQILTIKMSILSFSKILNTVKLGHKLKDSFTDLFRTTKIIFGQYNKNNK